MKSVWRWLWLLALLACLAGAVACDGSDDDDDSGGDDDDNDDDNGDDDADDDDLIDDDTGGDDDTTTGNVCPFLAEGGLERIAGGTFATTGTALAVGPDHSLHLAATQGRAMCIYSSTDGESWTPHYVTRYAADPSLAVDAAGVHLAFVDLAQPALKYATQSKGEWVMEVVDDTVGIDAQPVVALDAAGFAHISYYDGQNERRKYATNAHGAWQTETLDLDAVWDFSALAIDSAGVVHIGCLTGEISDRSIIIVSGEAGAWTTETAATLGEVRGEHLALAVDPDEHLHLAFYNNYVTNASGDWQTDTYDYEEAYAFVPAMIADAANVHIGYVRQPSNDPAYVPNQLHYARLTDGEWTREAIGAPDEIGDRLAIALAPGGEPLLASHSADLLFFARTGDEDWNNQVVADGEVAGESAALALSESGVKLVCYFATSLLSSHGKLRCAVPHGDGWSSETMDNIGWPGLIERLIALVLAPDGDAHVFYANSNDDFLHHQYGVPGDWQSTEPPDRYDPSAVAATIDGSGLVHLAFGSGENSEVFHEVWDGSAWSSSRAVNGANSGVSLALDADGHAYVGYDNGLYPKGWYATDRSGDWELVQYSEYGESSSLAFTPDGNLAISHYSNDHGLWYGVYDGKSFDDEQIDTDDAAGIYNWLAFDADGFAHIVYYVWSNDFDLRYATNRSGSWQIYDLDTVGDVGEYATFAIDAEGIAHVAYLGENALWYRTFDTAGE